MNEQKRSIGFIHPDLGIGGAQQLVVNLCLAVKNNGYDPHIYTPYHHKSFPETHDGTITVHQHGSFFGLLPDTVYGKFKGLLAYIRSIICVLWLVLFGKVKHHAIVADQVSVVLPILRIFGYKTIFYCHFPDKLLSGQRNFVKKVYRFFIDLVEQISLLFAHKIYVNSLYTKDVFYKSFPLLKTMKIEVQVLYPSLDFSKFDQQINEKEISIQKIQKQINGKYFFSLNRYERKKNINLAIISFAKLVQNDSSLNKMKLVIAGGYDLKVNENIEHLIQLKDLAKNLQIQSSVHFYTSISNEERIFLLKNAECVLYTPENEHFGIVPCEAMYFNIPIIADNSGGPKESVGQDCGYLCNNEQEWVINMKKVVQSGKQSFTKGKQRMINKFGFIKFSEIFCEGIAQIQNKKE